MKSHHRNLQNICENIMYFIRILQVLLKNPKRTGVDALLPSAKQLLALREELRSEEERLVAGRLELARRYQEPDRVAVPRDEFSSWFEEAADAS